MWWVWIKKHSADLYYGLVLITLAYLALRGYSLTHDLDTWDEAGYIAAAKPGTALIPHLSWAPLYVFFCRFIRLFVSDPIELYYANSVVQIGMLVGLHYLVSRRLRVRPFFSFLGALFILLTCLHTQHTNKTGFFNASTFYLLFFCVTFLRGERARIIALAYASLVLIYLRQDNLITGFGFLILAIWHTATSAQSLKARVATCFTLFGSFFLFLTLCSHFASPFSTNRTWNAFIDHFYWGNTFRHGLPPSHDHVEYTEALFGKTRSITRAFLAQPRALSEHFLYNAGKLPSALLGAFGEHEPLTRRTLKESWLTASAEMYLLFGLSFLCGLVARLTEKVPISRTERLSRWKRFALGDSQQTLWWWLVAFSIVRALSTILLLSVVPRYLVELLFFSYLSLFLLLDRWVVQTPPWVFPVGAVLLIALFATADFQRGAAAPPFKSLVQWLRRIPDLGAKAIYSDGMGFTYSPAEPRRLNTLNYQTARERGAKSFGIYLNKRLVDLVIIDWNTYAWLVNVERKYGVELSRPRLDEMITSAGYHARETFSDGTVLYSKMDFPERNNDLALGKPGSP